MIFIQNKLCNPAEIEISKLLPFEDHPYKVPDNEEMEMLTESIRTEGILSPLVVRPLENTDEYEVISGHRRLYAAQKAELKTVPAFVYEISRAEAAILLVDSNLHREHILPSEKAFVDAMTNSDNKFLQVGGNIIKGIWNGIKDATEWLYGLLSGWVDNVVDWIKSKFGIASPSKVMEQEVGYWMARGIGSGFSKEMRAVNAQIADSIDTSFDVPRPGGSGRAQRVAVTTAGGKVVNLTINAQKLTDADIAMLLELVNQKLGDDL